MPRSAHTEPYHALMVFTPFAIEFRYESIDSDAEPIDRVSVIELLEAPHDHVSHLLTRDCKDGK